MHFRKPRKLIFIIIIVGIGVIFYQYLWIFDPVLARIYDLINQQKPILTEKELSNNLSFFKTKKFKDLPTNHSSRLKDIKGVKCKGKAFKEIYSQSIFYEISWFDRYKYLVGRKRVKDFLIPDRLFKKNIPIPFTGKFIPTKNKIRIPSLDKTQFLFIDLKLLKKVILLNQTLKSKKYSYSYSLTSGFRPPLYNQMVKGKSCSRHQHGDAIDIHVYDINKDGKTNQKDKSEMYKILDEIVIKDEGGLGDYKNLPNVIHFDTRGYKARWNY